MTLYFFERSRRRPHAPGVAHRSSPAATAAAYVRRLERSSPVTGSRMGVMLASRGLTPASKSSRRRAFARKSALPSSTPYLGLERRYAFALAAESGGGFFNIFADAGKRCEREADDGGCDRRSSLAARDWRLEAQRVGAHGQEEDEEAVEHLAERVLRVGKICVAVATFLQARRVEHLAWIPPTRQRAE